MSTPDQPMLPHVAIAARAVVDLLGVSRGERVLLVRDERERGDFAACIRDELDRCGALWTEAVLTTLDLRAAESLVVERLAADAIGAVIEVAGSSLYDSATIRSLLSGGGRMVSLADVDDGAAMRLLGDELDLMECRATQAAIAARFARARRITVSTGDGTARLTLRLDPDGTSCGGLRRALRRETGSVFGVTPIPVARGQLAFLPGQVSIVGRRRVMEGEFVADAYLHPIGPAGRLLSPITLRFRRGRLIAAEGLDAPSFTPSIERLSVIKHVSIGFLRAAGFAGGLLEAERVRGAITVGLGDFPNHIDAVARNASVDLDGDPLVTNGALVIPRRSMRRPALRTHGIRARVDGMTKALSALAKPMSIRTFVSSAGRIAFAGPCPQEASWLARWSGVGFGAVTSVKARPRGLRAAVKDADLAVIRISPQRARLESIATDAIAVPLLAAQVISLEGVRENGARALNRNSSAANDLRVMRKEKLTKRVVPLDVENLAHFYERYYIPTTRERHGQLAGYASVEELAAHIGSADLVEVLRDGDPVAATIVALRSVASGVDAALLQCGLLDGDESLFKCRAMAATYAYGGEHAAERGATELRVGGSLPFLRDGVLQFKSKWTARLGPSSSGDAYRVVASIASVPVRCFLKANPLACFNAAGRPVGIACAGPETDPTRIFELLVCGLERLFVVLDGADEAPIRAALAARTVSPETVRCLPVSDMSLAELIAS